MSRAFFLLLAALSIPPVAIAGPCTGTETKLASVERALAREDLTAAEAALAPVEASHPDCPAALLARARVQAAEGHAQEAEGMFIRYAHVEPEDPKGIVLYARFLLTKRDYQQADALSAAALKRDPSSAAALALRGQILDMKGESQAGLNLLEQASRKNPGDPETEFQLGAIYHRASRRADAVEHLDRAVSIDPRNSRAWDYLALDVERLGQVDRADEAYRRGLTVNQPGPHFDAFLDYNYGRFLMKRDQISESKIHLDRAVELAPRVRAVWYERAKVNLELKDYHQARVDAEKAASLPDAGGVIIDLQIYVLLEQIYRRLGQDELARKYAELARETPVPQRGERR